MIPDIQQIKVYYRDQLAGTLQLAPDGSRCVFEYDRGWLANGFSLSPLELPLQEGLHFADPGKFDGNFALFEDSLPDGYGLYLLDKILHGMNSSLAETTPLQRLALVGKAGMGALTYLPEIPSRYQRAALSTDDLDQLQEKALAVLAEKSEEDVKLLYYNSANSGGARPKVVLKREDGSRWLVKFRHLSDAPDIGAREFLYMQTAEECGIEIPRIALIQGKYFAAERFDIDRQGERIHAVTAAALLKSDFRQQSLDYTQLLALTGYLTQDPAQVEEMFRRMVFNLIADNKDDHGKNFTFLYDGRWRLSPAYDLTYVPKGPGGEHATSRFYHGNPGLEMVVKAGMEIRITRSRCLEIIDKVQQTCRKNLPSIIFLR